MDDSFYEGEVEEEYPYEAAPQRKMSGWTIALIVLLVIIVLCCLCMFAVIAGLTLVGPAVGETFSTVIEEMMTLTPVP